MITGINYYNFKFLFFIFQIQIILFMTKITEYIYLGAYQDAEDKHTLFQNQIKSIIIAGKHLK